MISALVRCPNCQQEFDGDEDKPIFRLQYCEHYVCYMCSFDHRDDCRLYWKRCKAALTRKLDEGL